MQYRVNPRNGDRLSALGFGVMRLPTRGGNVDAERAVALLRRAAEAGVNYFDTAYIYHKGKSEEILGRALAGGLREKVFVATKLPPFMVRSLDGAKKILARQLERLQTNYVDYYLIHMLVDRAMFDRLASLGVMDWLREQKQAGTVRNLGFSFHGTAPDFREVLQAFPWDFCQIQYNYLDENSQAGKAGLLLAASLGIPVVVMVPLRGGQRVNSLPGEALDVFARCAPGRTPAEWALRWVWDHPQVHVVLSGMGDEAQLEENLRTAGDAAPGALTKAERGAFARVKAVLLEKTKVPCTACGYCMPCPHGVDIPECFAHLNDKYLLGDRSAKFRYMRALGGMAQKPSNASLCVACGRCEKHCPQSIAIIRELKTVVREMEG
ncbi:MAG TPA: aldo/keto reductase, partial [Candidatus Limnocylindria bacterium]|nr:aldo/keto reductase [Candidatus Limnocylindria bacterium]